MVAEDKILEALGKLNESVQSLDRDATFTNRALRELGKAHQALEVRLDEAVERFEEKLARHDSGFRSATTVDVAHQGQLAALLITCDDARTLAKESLHVARQMSAALVEVEKKQEATARETSAQTTAIAKVDGQTLAMTIPQKYATIVNLVIVIGWVIASLLRAAGKL